MALTTEAEFSVASSIKASLSPHKQLILLGILTHRIFYLKCWFSLNPTAMLFLTLQVNQLVILTASLVLRLYMYMTSSYVLNQGQTSKAVVVSHEILTV